MSDLNDLEKWAEEKAEQFRHERISRANEVFKLGGKQSEEQADEARLAGQAELQEQVTMAKAKAALKAMGATPRQIEGLIGVKDQTYEDQPPVSDLTQEQYGTWFDLSYVDGVRVGPSYANLLEIIDAVGTIHQPFTESGSEIQWCKACTTGWPCATINAVKQWRTEQ
jgi:hypothetical protein